MFQDLPEIPLNYPDMDIPHLNIADTKQMIVDYYNQTCKLTENNSDVDIKLTKPPLIFGATGVGKSDIIEQVCDDLDIELTQIECVLASPVSILNKLEELSGSESLNKGGIILLEYFAEAHINQLMMIADMINDNILTKFSLKSKFIFVALSNRPYDSKTYKDFSEYPELLESFSVYHMTPTIKDFKIYAEYTRKHGFEELGGDGEPTKKNEILYPIPKDITEFLEEYPQYFYYMPRHSIANGLNPRKWEAISQKLLMESVQSGCGFNWLQMPEVKIEFIVEDYPYMKDDFMKFMREQIQK